MQLPSLRSNSSQQEKRYLTCFITESSVTVGVWEVVDSKITVVAVGTPKEWQENSQLADAMEFAITELKDTAKNISEMLLGLPDDWVQGNDIISDKKSLLKNIAQQIKVMPIGFVVSHEALWKFLSQKHEAASSALFFEVTHGEIVLSLIEHGQSVQNETVGRSEVLIEDLQEAIARINKDPFPPQVFFFSATLSGQELTEIKNEFLNFDWVAEGMFSRIPEVDVLDKTTVVQAISETGGQEVIKGQQAAEDVPVSNLQTTEKMQSQDAEKPILNAPPKAAIDQPADANEFGFESVKAVVEDQADTAGNVTAFGVPMSEVPEVPEPRTAVAEEVDTTAKQTVEPPSPKPKKLWQFWKRSPANIRKATPTPANRQSRSVHKPFLASRKSAIPVIAGVMVVFIIGGYFWLKSQVKADVKILLKTETVEQNVSIVLDAGESADSEESNVLKANVVTKQVSSSQETSTTGSKLIGEKATGTVTIFNGTENTKTFSQGTELQANDKTYVLEEEVTVASATAQIDNNLNKTLESGKQEAKVVATDIGAEFNLDENTEFTIANFSKDTYVARNEDKIEGGSSREIQAVSEDDRQKLLQSLKKELVEQAEKEFNDQKQDGEYIVLSDEGTIVEQNFSAEVGEETQSLKLEATLEAEAYIYQAQDLRPLAEQTLVSLVPDGGALLSDTVSILSKESQEASSSSQVTLDAQLSAQYTPPTDSDEWLEQITGRTLEQAQRVLEEKEAIDSVEIILRPGIAKTILGNMPGDSSRIQIIKEVE